MTVRFDDLRFREVINIKDGTRLGYIEDAEISEDGSIAAAIIPGRPPVFGIFGKRPEYAVPWDRIVRIGDDIVLTDFEIPFGVRSVQKSKLFDRLFK